MLLIKNNTSLWSFYLRQLHPQQQSIYVQRVGTKVVKPFGVITRLREWVQPAGKVWQTKLTEAQLNCGWAPFSIQHGKNLHRSCLQDFQLVCSSKVAQILEVKYENLSGCLEFATECQGQSPKSSTHLHPATQGMAWDGKSHTGLCGHSPPGPMDGD